MFGLQLPLGVHIAPNHPRTRTRHVQQHLVRPSPPLRHIRRMLNVASAQNGNAGAGRPLLRLRQLIGLHVHAENFALVLHQRRHMQGLPARAGTAVQHAVPGLRIEVGGNALRTPVLHFVPAVLETAQMLQARPLRQHDGLRAEVRGGGLNAFGGQAFEDLFAARLPGVGAQNDVGRLVQGRGQRRPAGAQRAGRAAVEPVGIALGDAKGEVRKAEAAFDLPGPIEFEEFFEFLAFEGWFLALQFPEEAPPADHLVAVLGHEGPVARAPFFVGSEDLVYHAVGVPALSKGPFQDFEDAGHQIGIGLHATRCRGFGGRRVPRRCRAFGPMPHGCPLGPGCLRLRRRCGRPSAHSSSAG